MLLNSIKNLEIDHFVWNDESNVQEAWDTVFEIPGIYSIGQIHWELSPEENICTQEGGIDKSSSKFA